MNKCTHRGPGLVAGIASLLLLACLAARPAAAQQWSGLGANDNWSTAANWVGGVAPASSPTTAVSFLAATPRIAPIVDTPWTINRIDIIGNYNIGGQALTFAGIAPQILASAPNAVISAPIVL